MSDQPIYEFSGDSTQDHSYNKLQIIDANGNAWTVRIDTSGNISTVDETP